MKRIPFFVLLTLLSSAIAISQRKVEGQVQGAFRFVSETITPNAPGAEVRVWKGPDWRGIFIFHEGVYSIVLENQARHDDWHTRFPQNVAELGYQSVSGKYVLKGNKLFLKPEVALRPFSGMRPVDLHVSWQGEKLILTETLTPYIENLTDGKRTIVLERMVPR